MAAKKLCKIEKGEMVSGVCTGLAAFFGIDVTIVRLIWLMALFFGVGSPILVYIVLAIVLPECDPDEVVYTEYEEEEEDDYYDPYGERDYFGDEEDKKQKNERY